MYVIGRVTVEETVSILSLEEPTVSFSIEEFEHYVNLFEEMQERMDNEEGEESGSQEGFEWSPMLDEFDLADIAEMRERYGLIIED